MNTCPLCGNKLQHGYCPECGGNITNVCDADEGHTVHESHASVMPAFSSAEEKKRSYTAGTPYAYSKSAYQTRQNPSADPGEKDSKRVLLVLLAFFIPWIGIVLGGVFLRAQNDNARRKTGGIMIAAGIVGLFFMPIIQGIFMALFDL